MFKGANAEAAAAVAAAPRMVGGQRSPALGGAASRSRHPPLTRIDVRGAWQAAQGRIASLHAGQRCLQLARLIRELCDIGLHGCSL